jgi:peptidoglycan/xylan/chitin deacetylase (PgdA/CDA1 family)
MTESPVFIKDKQPRTRYGRLAAVAILVVSSCLICGFKSTPHPEDISQEAAFLTNVFGSEQPKLWSETIPGIVRYLDYPAADKKIALTLDACGSKNDGYDRELLEFLAAEQIPVTLFVNARWIDKNPQAFKELAGNSNFDIENHGLHHLPASVNGRSAYGLKGTASVEALVEEVEVNRQKIAGLTGVETTYFRSGTAFYDEVAVKVIHRLGQKIAGFSVLGDAGATYTAEQIEKTLSLVQANDIIIAHMNHPERQTAEGLIPALKTLKGAGFHFVTLRDAPTRDTMPAGYRQLRRNLGLDINLHPLGSGAHQQQKQ